MKHTATAFWKGSGKEGSGTISTESGNLNKAEYSANARFASGKGTNPEELIAAAHAGCYTMKLSFILAEAGFVADSIETTSAVSIESGTITGSHLTVKAKINGISKEKFDASAKDAKENCPVSKALKMDITLEASLI